MDWTDVLPPLWKTKPLKAVAIYTVSNVDKVPDKDECPVRLCNYTDVYKNEFISLSLEFMQSTATVQEIEKFRLIENDVVITKDSESWDDIAVPALVVETANDLVCGYHLAVLRPNDGQLFGRFLFRCLQARVIRLQLELVSTGVTRFGLPKDEIGRLLLPIPPLATQRRIADYLDAETAQIDALIAEKEGMLALLAEKRAALVSRAVTRGLDPAAPLKPSGLEWLGEIPAHWAVKRAKQLFTVRDERSELGDEELLSVSHITGVTPRAEKEVFMFKAESNIGYKLCYPGDLAVNTLWAWMGAMGVANQLGLVSPDYHVYVSKGELLPAFVEVLCRSKPFIAEVVRYSKGVWSSRLRLYPEAFFDIRFPVPPKDEQQAIVSALSNEHIRTAELESILQNSLALLKERRSALITAAVTGQLDREVMAA
jgi:type I restriction enzyme, S subunit